MSRPEIAVVGITAFLVGGASWVSGPELGLLLVLIGLMAVATRMVVAEL